MEFTHTRKRSPYENTSALNAFRKPPRPFPFNSPAGAVAIKNGNYPGGLINIRIITPLEYKQAVMNMGC